MLRKSEFLKNKKVRALLCIELLLVLIGVVGLFGKTGVVVGRESSSQLLEEGVALPAGVYTLRVYYKADSSDDGYFELQSENENFKALLSNPVYLFQGGTERDCQFYLTDSVEHLRLLLTIPGGTEFLGAEIIAGTEGSRIYLFWLLLICVPLDLFIFLYMYNKRQPIPTEKLAVIFGVPALVLMASLPMMVDHGIVGDDWGYHVMRIEALFNAIKNGELATRMSSFWMREHGYASSYFYCDTLLILPALLRLLGLNLPAAYRIFLAAVNLSTALIAYVSFKGCFRNRYIALFGCAMYTLAPYRMHNVYIRAAVGEYSAMIFLPLLVWGFYRIYTENPDDKGYLWNWALPVIGFSGIIQSHVLSCEMVGFFVILLCLILWKKTFRRKTFSVLALIVGITAVINLWYIVPFLDMMMSNQYIFNANSSKLIQNDGEYLAQLFFTLQPAGWNGFFSRNGMLGAESLGLGVALMVCLILWLLLRCRLNKSSLTDIQRREKKAGDVGFFLTVLALFMSTNLFPWDFLSSRSEILTALIGTLQLPMRMNAIASVTCVFTACIMAVWLLREDIWFLSSKTVLILIVMTSMVFGAYQLNDYMLSKSTVHLYSVQNMGNTNIAGGEYMPASWDDTHISYHGPILSDRVVLDYYEKDGLEVSADVYTEEGGWIELPMLYYKGYRAEVYGTGEQLQVVKGRDDVRVLLPKDFSGSIHVWFAGMWYWHAAEALSVITGGGLLLWYIIRRIRKSGVCGVLRDKIKKAEDAPAGA